jgi:UDP-N-acetylglucosamine--N-acetylmuramyl-(pentapeptide) pyrophosphoryl-undecaprenol N-acetylglucosamine transferase
MSDRFSTAAAPSWRVAIACGGTGGHLFPGIAVGEELLRMGGEVTLLISPKEVDQQAVKAVVGMKIETLPAVALTRGGYLGFAAGFWKSWRMARRLFASDPPKAVLAMGGFTSAPPILAGRGVGARTFLHESNSVPGRANRWLARVADRGFIYFPQALSRWHGCPVEVIGMPVRSGFREPIDPGAARMALGLEPGTPVILVMGGSQGAGRINELIVSALPLLAGGHFQILHLTGAADFEKTRAAYASSPLRAVVKPFLSEMDLALGAADVAVSRAGASSSAELAAMRLPSILIPYPTAADNHQLFNARAFFETGAAWMLEQREATPQRLGEMILDLARNQEARASMRDSLGRWYHAGAAEEIAARICAAIGVKPAQSPAYE